MGAAILLHALRRRPELVDRSVVTAPMIEIAPRLRPPGAEWLVRLCHGAGLAGRPVPARRRHLAATANHQRGNVLTSDPERYGRTHHILTAAPHLGVGRPTFGWLHEAFGAMATLRKPEVAEAITSPLLVVAGDQDRVTSTPAAMAFARRTGRGAALALPHCAHDVLMERDVVRDAFWLAFDAFVND
jgi:lysophospholipase